MTLQFLITPLLLLLGVMLWQLIGRADVWGNLPPPIVWIGVLVVGLVPPIRRRLDELLDRVARPTPRARLIIALVVAVIAGAYLYLTAARQGRDFALKILDEHSYAIQGRMLASGRLWMPQHPAADSFDSAYVIVRPVYASMYFPGTAITLVPAVWLGLPWWITPLILSAASAGLLYRVVAEAVDGVAGLTAALLLVSLPIFRELSLRLYAQTPMLFLALCATWAWLAWRRDPRPWRAAVVGALAGWMLITRPLDAVAWLLPIAVATALVRERVWKRAIVASALGMAPFLMIQLAANRGITGSVFTTPHAYYAARDFPGVTLGFHEQASPESLVTKVPQKRALYRDAQPEFQSHRPANFVDELLRARIPQTIAQSLPNNLLVILLPLGVAAAIGERRRKQTWMHVAPLPLFVLAYAFYLFYYAHYVLVVAPVVVTLVTVAVAAATPRLRLALTLCVTMLAVYGLPELDRSGHDDMLSPGDLRQIDQLVATLPKRPALVLFTWQPGVPFWREPVYNIHSADIDSADVIRAHDLPGEPNRVLLEYYAARQPDRQVYVVTRVPGGEPTMRPLGRVADVRPEDASPAIIPATTQTNSH